MSDLFWLTDEQMQRIEPYFPLSHGVSHVDDRRIVSGIIFVIRNGLRWRDAPTAYGPAKTITTGSSAGAEWAFSTGYLPGWQPRVERRIN